VPLRLWRPDDAAALHAALRDEFDRLSPWIPAAVADPATPSDVRARLEGYARDAAAERAWRYGLWSDDGAELWGELSLFPRDASRRVARRNADRLEIGYWLRAAVTGRGIATDAARTAIAMARAWRGYRAVEIRCDARNAASAGVPARLGFTCVDEGTTPGALQVWSLSIGDG
jgi:RimJ/RimL family protein N-acetyltransferase